MHVSTRQYSSKDLAGHTKMKTRQPGQNTSSEVAKRDLKRELDDKERKVAVERGRKDKKEDKEAKDEPILAIKDKEENGERSKRDKNVDADDSDESSDGDESSDEESDSEDETDELLRELERIKKEREQERLSKEASEKEEAAQRREAAMLTGNPLLNADYSIKRKWYDDVVFKNQARDEPETKKRFINDTTRNDFARKFMRKYIQ